MKECKLPKDLQAEGSRGLDPEELKRLKNEMEQIEEEIASARDENNQSNQ